MTHQLVPLLYLLYWLFLLPRATVSQATVSTKSYVWGPGLRSEFVVPARYFYLQAVHVKDDKNFTTSPGSGAFNIEVLDPEERPIPCWSDLLDRHDGSFLFRYRLYASAAEIHIRVLTSSGEHVADSPYILKDVRMEDCFCPQEGWSFSRAMKCPKRIKQIEHDLKQFKSVDLNKTIPESIRRFSDAQQACFAHYTIINNEIFAKVHGPHTGFRMFSDAFLLSLVRKVRLPDVEFIVNLGDWPQERRVGSDKALPIFSWCGSTDTTDIVMPTYDITEATLETLARVEMDMQSIQKLPVEWRWHKKLSKAIFRGRDSRQERLDLVRISKKHPDLIDAKLTNYFFFLEQEKELGKGEHISFFEFFKYKYQLNIDGTVAAYRFPWLLAGGSLVFKQDSPYYEHFYSDLEPYRHYVPIKRDLSDLLEKLEWAKKNDDKAQQIARNGLEYARDHLMPEDIYCYYYLLISEYSKRFVTKPVVRDGMELLEQPKHDCDCVDEEDGNPKEVKDEL